MKKLFLTVVALVVAVGVFASAMFPDVPEKHWAYEYVKHLKDKGIVIGYPDGTFKGDRNITRYEEAAMISRLIGLIENQIVGPYIADVLKVLDAMSARLGSTIERLGNLEKKVQELAGATRVEELAKAVETLKQTVNIHDKDVIKLYEAIANLQKKHEQDLQKLALQFEDLVGDVQDLAQKQQALEKALSTLEGNVSKLEKRLFNIEPIKDVVKDLSSIARLQSAKVTKLESDVADLSSALNNAVKTIGDLSNRLTKVEQDVAALPGRIEKLERRASENEKLLDNQAAKLGELALKVEEFEAFKAMHDEQIDYIFDELDSVNTQLSELRDGLFALREDVSAELTAMKSNVDERFTQVGSTIDSVKAELLSKIEELKRANAALTGAVIGAIIIAVAAMIVGAM